MTAYLFVLGTIVFTVYGQIVTKWRVDEAGAVPTGGSDRLRYAAGFLTDPWMISVVLAVLVAAACWIVALTTLELSRAYPLISGTFVLVVLLGALIFDESLTTAKVIGVLLIVAGLAVGSQA